MQARAKRIRICNVNCICLNHSVFRNLSGAGFDGALDLQGIAQPQSVTTAVQFVFTWIPLIMFAVISVILLLFFRLDRDLKKLKAEKGIAEA